MLFRSSFKILISLTNAFVSHCVLAAVFSVWGASASWSVLAILVSLPDTVFYFSSVFSVYYYPDKMNTLLARLRRFEMRKNIRLKPAVKIDHSLYARIHNEMGVCAPKFCIFRMFTVHRKLALSYISAVATYSLVLFQMPALTNEHNMRAGTADLTRIHLSACRNA